MSLIPSNCFGYGGLVSQSTGTFIQAPSTNTIVFTIPVSANSVHAHEFRIIGDVVNSSVHAIGTSCYQKNGGIITNVGGNNVVQNQSSAEFVANGLTFTLGFTGSGNTEEFLIGNSSATDTIQWRWFITLYSQ